jgi:hypothetical protein
MPAFPSSDFITIGSGLNVAAFYPVDYRFVFANATDRLALSWYAAYEGLVTYQQDTQELYVLINKGPEGAPTIGQNSSWRLVGGGSGTNYAAEWAFTNTNNQSFAFTGDGLPSPENDPTLYLLRGQSYRFSNNNTLGSHPFQIQTDVSTAVNGGTPYNLGVTNNRASGSQQLIFDVPMSAPDKLYYQCTSHPAMSGSLIIVGNPGSGGSGSGFPFEGDAVITGSLEVTGSITASAGVINQLTASYAITSSYALEALVEITKEISSSYADSASLAESASFVAFDGNRAVTNQDQPVGIRDVNFGANGVTDFIEKVYFANTAPTISSLYYQNTQEFTPSGSLVGAINTADAESQAVTVQTQSSYTLDQFRITGNSIYLNVEASESMNTDSSQAFDAAALPVRATDTLGLFTDKTLYIQILPNTAPVFRENSISGNVITGTQTIPLLESSTNGVKKTIYFTDAQNDTVTIETGSLSAKFQNDFQINVNYPSKRIQIQQINNVDFDTYPSYSFALTASDQHYPTQDSESIAYLPFNINVTDNLPPVMSDQPLPGVNENENVTNSRPQISGFYRNAGQISATGPEAGDTLTFTSATLTSLSVGGVNVPLGTYFADGDAGSPSQSDPSENAFEMNSTGLMSRKASAVLNSDLIDSYVYTVTVQDNYDPGTTSALITIPIADDVAPAITAPGNLYINESAEINGIVTNNPNGVSTPQFQFQSTYNVQNETVNWQLNPSTPFALDGNQRMSANANISASYFSPATIDFSITASNTFGTENKQAYSVTVTDNQAPTFNISNVNTATDNTTAGANIINVTNIQDVEQNLNYTVSLSGTDAALFNITTPTITTNNGSTFLTAVNNIVAGTYSINVIVTDSYGSSRTTAHSITVTQSATYGPMYIYATDYGTAAYNTTIGYDNNPNNPGDATLSSNPYPLPELVNYGIDQDAGLDNITLSALSSTIQQYATVIQPDGTNPSVGSALAAKSGGAISGVSGGPFRWIVLIPSGSSITQIPIDGMVNGIDGGNNPDKSSLYYYSGGQWNAIDSRINKVDFGTDSTKNKGYRYWYVIGSTSLITTGGSLQIRIVPENGTAPS